MSYLFGVGGALILQIGFSFVIIATSSGNGSFVGLGAMLLAVFGVPLTALLNFIFVRAHRKKTASPYVARIVITSLILPAAQLALSIAVSVFRL